MILLAERFTKGLEGVLEIRGHRGFAEDMVQNAARRYHSGWGILGTVRAYFGKDLLGPKIEPETERRIVVLKQGFAHMPSTKMALVLQGLGTSIESEEVLAVFAS